MEKRGKNREKDKRRKDTSEDINIIRRNMEKKILWKRTRENLLHNQFYNTSFP
jgi:hypothetical protein